MGRLFLGIIAIPLLLICIVGPLIGLELLLSLIGKGINVSRGMLLKLIANLLSILGDETKFLTQYQNK